MNEADFDFNDNNEQDYEKMHDRNLVLVGGDSEFFYKEKIRLLHRYFPDLHPARVLDFGCGRGRLSTLLADSYPSAEVLGVDISQQSIDVARQRVSHPRVRFQLEPPKGEEFHLIVSSGVFHHIEPPKQAAAMNKLAQSLAPGASLVLFEHNPLNPLTQYIVRHEPFDFKSYLITPWRMKRIVSEAELSLRRIVFTAFLPSFLKALLPLDRLLARFPFGGQYMVIIQRK